MKGNIKGGELLDAALREADLQHYVLRLYVTGTSPQSTRAIVNLRKILEENLPGRYELEVIDVVQDPQLAKSEQIFVAPTLVKQLPAPLQRFIGDMSETDRLLVGLNIKKPE